ncbi:YagK/YfjJ domain-containing protein [Lysobacter claricitrinus]|uniref:hypothetical protein n=1 Tax=Lysobacter claricitrinus TaxID=3367728 RepID=UPI0037DA931E
MGNKYQERQVSLPASGNAKHSESLCTSKIRHIVLAEQAREMIAETCIRVEARNGLVRVPHTNQYYATDQEFVWFTGTDDRLFKDFTEGAMLRLHKALLQDDSRPCAPAPRMQRGVQPMAYRLTVLGRKIVQCCSQYRQDWSVMYANHAFHPVTTVMLRAMKRYAFSVNQSASEGATQATELVRLLEQLTRFVRRACGSRRFTNELTAHERKAQDNFASARELIYHLAARHSRLLILRVDLYWPPHCEAGKAQKEINGFLRWLRGKACKRNLLPGYRGYVIKCENGMVRGMHWHLMVICDGNLQRNGGYLTHQLGEMWARRTCQGPGSYYNCWADRAKHDYDGLGVVELDDWEKMVGLRKALHYLAKQDCVLKVSGDKGQNFRRSEITKDRGNRGRRRNADDSLRLLRRMLGGKRSKYPAEFKPQPRSCHPSVRAGDLVLSQV